MAKKRIQLKKISDASEVNANYNPKAIVKFHDYIEIPYEDGIGHYIQDHGIGPWNKLTEEFPGIVINRMYTSVKPEEMLAIVARAKERNPDYHPPNFLTFFVIECPPNLDSKLLAKAIGSWQSVEVAYVASYPAPPPQIAYPPDDKLWSQQGYLDAAPSGIDAEFAWKSKTKGGSGEGIQLVDVERGCMLNHEDLINSNMSLISGSNADLSHGTGALGIICATANNGKGVVGIASHAKVKLISVIDKNGGFTGVWNAIWIALSHLNFGDVLLLEEQASGFLPIELYYSEFKAIELANALGIVVVEPAGNGNKDLDLYVNASNKQVFNPNSQDFHGDSGAIIVGAGRATHPHDHIPGKEGQVSNWGDRINCYAWGESICTCYDSPPFYITNYGGTSGASAIIAGVALVVQAVAEQNLGYRFSPSQLRSILSDETLGTPCESKVGGLDPRIGVMPDLKRIITKVLNVPADVYIRDFVGDTGDPHSGAVNASPDVILLPQKVLNHQQAFGENSGTENSNSLGQEVKKTNNDSYIYVRVRNRGGLAANNVVADIYWSEVATLVMPDLWTQIGKITIPTVPPGDLLTVSEAIAWPANEMPGTGHYCFIALIGNEEDPAPLKTDFEDWNTYCRFIRENNNVTWRNFNIVGNTPPPPQPSPKQTDLPWGVPLPFLATGAQDMARIFSLEVVARLPEGSRAWLEAPFHFVQSFGLGPRVICWNKKLNVAYVALNPHGRTMLGSAPFAEQSGTELKLIVNIPKEFRMNEYEICVSQSFEKEEVGRVTWRLVSNNALKKREKFSKT